MKITEFTKIIGLLCAAVLLISALPACAAPSADPAGGGHEVDEAAQAEQAEQASETEPKAVVEEPFISYAPPYYSIGYSGNAADHLTSAPAAAKAGDTVEIRTEVLYDADIHVYADGQEIPKSHYDSDWWGYSFVMPEKDVRVTATFYTKDEIWGTAVVDENAMREKYPEYFDLSTSKGLEVYVWQMAPNRYTCGVMEGTNRDKTPEEILNLKGASVEEMKVILSAYDISEENVLIIPWQHPISSYLGDYWIRGQDETPDALAIRRQQYVDMLRTMLFGDDETGFYGSDLRIHVKGQAMVYERYEAGSGSLTPNEILDTFSEETEIEGIFWEVHSVEEYPDLSYVLVISGTNSSWTYRIKGD
ncbi:MAG: hypothetical protein IKQ92_12560 [Clostridia bacterium]|nr:hypothetical protein [Clostridia bacterium]